MIAYTDDVKKMNLFEKIAQISSEIEYLQKDDKVGFGANQYKAISIEKVMTAIADKICKYGIVIYPIEQEYERKDEEVTKKDGTIGYNRISDVRVKYQVINIHNTDEKIIVVSAGTGCDTQDKGVGKAMTYAYKNMIIKLFSIATGDDTDKVHSDDYSKQLYEGNKNYTNSFKLSQAQIKRIYAINSKAGYNNEQLDNCILKNYNKKVADLSKSEYEEVCKKLEEKLK